MPSSAVILFDMSVSHIRQESDRVARLANVIASSNIQAEISDLFDLKRSAANLRHAADYLDDIRRRLDKPERENSV